MENREEEKGTAGVPYFVYIVRCEDGTLYSGIARDLKKRLETHLSRGKNAARYTKSHPVRTLEAAWLLENRAEASRLEAVLHRLSRQKKEDLLAAPCRIGELFTPLSGKVLPVETAPFQPLFKPQ